MYKFVVFYSPFLIIPNLEKLPLFSTSFTAEGKCFVAINCFHELTVKTVPI